MALEAAEIEAECSLSHGTLKPGRYVRLTVEDSGSGMDEATLSRIFEPFFTTKEVGRGTGLGLSLVYAIVTDSGGAIDVETTLGAGSVFSVYLPHAGDMPDGSADEPPALSRADQQRMRVTTRAYSAGADEVLQKPLSARELAASLARVLQSTEGRP